MYQSGFADRPAVLWFFKSEIELESLLRAQVWQKLLVSSHKSDVFSQGSRRHWVAIDRQFTCRDVGFQPTC